MIEYMKQLDTFTRSYLETALWSSTDESTPEGGQPFDANYSIDDLHPDTVAQAVAECNQFQEQAGDMIDGDTRKGGHDFWLTRNGHGAGFWDGDWPEHGDTLTAIAK